MNESMTEEDFEWLIEYVCRQPWTPAMRKLADMVFESLWEEAEESEHYRIFRSSF